MYGLWEYPAGIGKKECEWWQEGIQAAHGHGFGEYSAGGPGVAPNFVITNYNLSQMELFHGFRTNIHIWGLFHSSRMSCIWFYVNPWSWKKVLPANVMLIYRLT